MKKIILGLVVSFAFIPSVFAQYYYANYSSDNSYPNYNASYTNSQSGSSFTYSRGCDLYYYDSYSRITTIIGSTCANSSYNPSNYTYGNYALPVNNMYRRASRGYTYPTYSYQYVAPVYNTNNGYYPYNYSGYNNNSGYNNYSNYGGYYNNYNNGVNYTNNTGTGCFLLNGVTACY